MSLCTGSKGMPSADVVHIWQAIFDVSLFFTTLDWEQGMDSQIGMYHNTLEMEETQIVCYDSLDNLYFSINSSIMPGVKK